MNMRIVAIYIVMVASFLIVVINFKKSSQRSIRKKLGILN